MNATTRVLSVLASEPEAVMSAETAHALANKRASTPLALSTVKRALRHLRGAGLAEADEFYDRKTNRRINHWSATSEGIRENTYL